MLAIERATMDDAQSLIGAFFLIPIENESMRFEDFVIDPIYQNKGYGYQVLGQVEKLYSHIRTWRLSTPSFSVSNQHLYEKFGYIKEQNGMNNTEEIEYIKKC